MSGEDWHIGAAEPSRADGAAARLRHSPAAGCEARRARTPEILSTEQHPNVDKHPKAPVATHEAQPGRAASLAGWLTGATGNRFVRARLPSATASGRSVSYALGALIPVLWILGHWDAPLVEDALFWFVPTAIQQAEFGPVLAAHGPLPLDVIGHGAPIPPQWASGLPDYGHPPLWYWWLGAFLRFGCTLGSVRAACLLPAAAIGVGFVALADTHRRPLAGLAVWTIPGVLAQLLRPELDLPLLACVPLALEALNRGAWTRFAVCAALATWIKEPGVLLVVPGLAQALRRREAPVPVLAPVGALAVWAAVHGGLAPVVQSPASWTELGDNLLGTGRFLAVDQGRMLLLLGAGGLLVAPAELSFVLASCIFFAFVRYYANDGTLDAYTHVRYLLPAVAVFVVTTAARMPVPLALAQLLWLHRVHLNGPEASMAGIDSAYADRAALESLPSQATPWVGSYLAAGVGRTWTGYPDIPVRSYDFSTTPVSLAEGALLIESAYGEPATRLERGLIVEPVSTLTVGDVHARVVRVLAQNPAGWVPAAAPPR